MASGCATATEGFSGFWRGHLGGGGHAGGGPVSGILGGVSAVGRGVSGTGFRGGWRAAGRVGGLLLFSRLLC